MWGDAVILGGHVLNNYADIRKAFGANAVRELKKFDNRAWDAISPAEYYESDWKADNEDPLSRAPSARYSRPSRTSGRATTCACASTATSRPNRT